MMKEFKITILTLLFFTCFNSKAQERRDTIYIRTYEEDLSAKFHAADQNRYSVNFFFHTKWVLHKIERNTIFFSYQSPKSEGRNEWSSEMSDVKAYLPLKNLFTLQDFTKKLQEPDFMKLIFQHKVQIIMLYGAKCAGKVEIYPVKLGSDISSEG
jgi:hypothetical protein